MASQAPLTSSVTDIGCRLNSSTVDSTDRVRELESKLYLTIDAITTAGDSGHDPRGDSDRSAWAEGF